MDNQSIPDWVNSGQVSEPLLVAHNLKEVPAIMQEYVGIVRSDRYLNLALKRINLIYWEIRDLYRQNFVTAELLEARNLALLAQLVTRSALARHESRGLHFSSDFPETSKELKDTVLQSSFFSLHGQGDEKKRLIEEIR